MGIFLRQSHNIKPRIWGSPADVQYAIRRNMESIYKCNPDNEVLVMPWFWGFPLLDYSKFGNHGTNYGSTYKDGGLFFDVSGNDTYIKVANDSSFDFPDDTNFSLFAQFKTTAIKIRNGLIGKYDVDASPYEGYAFLLNRVAADGKIAFLPGTYPNHTTTPLTYNDGILHRAAATLNGNTAAIYVDGRSVISDSITPNVWGDDYNDLYIGSQNYLPTTRGFDGFLYEARISNVARTADQIALFHDRPWDLYRRVARPIWSIPAVGVTIPIFMQNMRGSFNSPGTRGGFIN